MASRYRGSSDSSRSSECTTAPHNTAQSVWHAA
jgi:hypothetical protein